jgi:hypothetical protein
MTIDGESFTCGICDQLCGRMSSRYRSYIHDSHNLDYGTKTMRYEDYARANLH